MKIGDLVRCREDTNAQYFGVIVDIESPTNMEMFQILWNDGDLSWIGAWKMEAYDENR